MLLSHSSWWSPLQSDLSDECWAHVSHQGTSGFIYQLHLGHASKARAILQTCEAKSLSGPQSLMLMDAVWKLSLTLPCMESGSSLGINPELGHCKVTITSPHLLWNNLYSTVIKVCLWGCSEINSMWIYWNLSSCCPSENTLYALPMPCAWHGSKCLGLSLSQSTRPAWLSAGWRSELDIASGASLQSFTMCH